MTTESKPVIQWLKETSGCLKGKTETPLSDSRVILADHLGKDTAWLAAHPDFLLPPHVLLGLDQKRERLANGEPLPYILGWWEFFGLRFKVTPAVLIPRPETELLVEMALAWLDEHPSVREIWDIGTGSGCIPLALLSQKTDLHAHAVDISPAALEVAGANAQTLGLSSRMVLHRSDLLSSIAEQPVQLLCANLPYIPSADVAKLDVSRYEPLVSLDGGEDGMRFIHKLLKQVSPRLVKPYCLLLEIEYRQADAVMKIAREIFPMAEVNVLRDLSGQSRVVCIEGDDDDTHL